MAKTEKTHFFDNPRNVKLVLYALYALCAASFAVDFAIHRHVVHPWEGFSGFYPAYGFAGIIVLVLLAKELRKLVLRKEDYYDG